MLREEALRPFTIFLDGDTAYQILREVRAIEGERLETGGFLFARERARTHEARIICTTGAGAGSLHGSHSMMLAREADVRAEMPDWLHGDDLRAVGDWHYHPTRGSTRPSRIDLNAWASVLWVGRRACLYEYPTIIVSPGGPLGPVFSGFVTRRDGADGVYTTAPAAIVDERGYV